MKTSEFTDKKVTELSRSHSDNFSDHDDDHSEFSFRFRPQQNRPFMDYVDRMRAESLEAVRVSDDRELLSMFDRKMEEYSKNLLHAVEGLSVRLGQLDTRTRKIEDSVDELKDSSAFNYRRTERNLKELENILTEVQVGIRDLKDKQEISEVYVQLTKLQILKSHQQSEEQKAKTSESQSIESNPTRDIAPQPQQLYHTQPNVNQNQSHQNPPAPIPTPSGQFPIQSLPQNLFQIPCSNPTYQQYSTTPNPNPNPIQPPNQTSPGAYQPYQQQVQFHQPGLPYTSHVTVDSQTQPQPPQNAFDPQTRHFPAQSFKELSYNPIYGAPVSAPPSQQQQQEVHYGSRSSGFLSGHSDFRDNYARYGPPLSSELRGSTSSSFGSNNNNSRVSQLPKARELPRALPMASEIDTRSSSGGTGNIKPVDDVIDNVVAMGFRRDLVRATVKKMTESGRSVDLNAVLDKLMNSGEAMN